MGLHCQTDNATHAHQQAPITPTSPGHATPRRLLGILVEDHHQDQLLSTTRAVHQIHCRLIHMLTLEVGHILQELICHPPLILKVLVEDRRQDQQLLPTTRVVHIIHRLLLHMLTLEVGHLLQELIRHSLLIISRRLLHMPSQRVAATKVPLTISRHLLRIFP